jgi:hypothetical protein
MFCWKIAAAPPTFSPRPAQASKDLVVCSAEMTNRYDALIESPTARLLYATVPVLQKPQNEMLTIRLELR